MQIKASIALLFIGLSFYPTWAQNKIIGYTPTPIPETLTDSYLAQFDLKLLASDLANLLNQSTGETYRIEPDTKNCTICLQLDTNFKHTSKEAGKILYSNNSINISGKYVTGISYALYSWLRELGFRFGLPGEEWNVIPTRTNLTLPKKEYVFFPAFKLRTIFESGGTFAVKDIDDKNEFRKKWFVWLRRNRMGADYLRIDGHIGELFNIMHEKTIREDTMIVAPLEGKRQYAIGAKLDPTYPKGIQLFNDWVINEFKKQQKNYPYFLPFKKYQTVDPGDGLDYCHTPGCNAQFKSVSDQVFTIANKVARNIRRENKEAGVSLLAYTERADTPSIKIEPNVHVMVVASAFQQTTTPDDLLLRWRKKTSNVSQYDYLNIGVWSYDQPFFDLTSYISRLQWLGKMQFEGMSFEASFSKFGAGILQNLLLQYLSTPFNSPSSALQVFCKEQFEEAAPFIEKLMQEWYCNEQHIATNRDHEHMEEDEIGRYLQYIADAENRVSSNRVREKIQQLKLYTLYLAKYAELYEKLPADAQLAEELLTYIWRNYNRSVFHTTQLNDLFKQLTTNSTAWNYSAKCNIQQLKPMSDEELNMLFTRYRKKYPYKELSTQPNEQLFRHLITQTPDSILVSSMDEAAFGKYYYTINMFTPASSRLKIRFSAAASPQKKGLIAVASLRSEDYIYFKQHFIFTPDTTGWIQFSVPAAGNYKLTLAYFNQSRVSFKLYPNQQLFYLKKASLPMNAMVWQQESKTMSTLSYTPAFYTKDTICFKYKYSNSVVPFSIYNNQGNTLNLVKDGNKLTNSLKQTITAYTNQVYRWPPINLYNHPFIFYLKPGGRN